MIILASASPRRKKILEDLEIKFEIQVSNFDESQIDDINPESRVKKLAFCKANEIYKKNKNETIIGADTLVYYNKKFYGKPKNEKEAFEMLKSLSNTYHEVLTGVCIIDKGKITMFSDVAKVFFRKISDKEIMDYIKTGEAFGKAGGYEIQANAGSFISYIDGDIHTVSGLPRQKTYDKLKEIGAI